jgi:hypothetical protein
MKTLEQPVCLEAGVRSLAARERSCNESKFNRLPPLAAGAQLRPQANATGVHCQWLLSIALRQYLQPRIRHYADFRCPYATTLMAVVWPAVARVHSAPGPSCDHRCAAIPDRDPSAATAVARARHVESRAVQQCQHSHPQMLTAESLSDRRGTPQSLHILL